MKDKLKRKIRTKFGIFVGKKKSYFQTIISYPAAK
jgi:hypothetical protein